MTKKDNAFSTLNQINVSKYVEKKGNFSYLSWSFAVQELLKVCPNATWDVHTFKTPEGIDQPYMKTETGYFVQVTVDVDGVKRTQVHPVLDNRNSPIIKPNAFHINTSIQRCLAKAIALHGLGLYIYAGEDLPEVMSNPSQIKRIREMLESDKCTLSPDEKDNALSYIEKDITYNQAQALYKKLETKMGS
tara:strand:+ start:1497 stop:2066 length:570 start_codon:yes stop_codon:yes gene_type:complete